MSTSKRVAGIERGQRQLNGPQTSARVSQPERTRYARIAPQRQDSDARRNRVASRHLSPGHRRLVSGTGGRTPYARQVQDLGAPAGFIEAGHRLLGAARLCPHHRQPAWNWRLRWDFAFFDSQERRDMHDVIEWVAEQPWCDGNVGMLGISYFAMTQLEAAVERPHTSRPSFRRRHQRSLRCRDAPRPAQYEICKFVSVDAWADGTEERQVYRSAPFAIARRLLNLPPVHKKFATMNGESANGMLNLLMKLPHQPRPWDELWQDAVVKHPIRDAWWDDRDLTPLLENIDNQSIWAAIGERATTSAVDLRAGAPGHSPCVESRCSQIRPDLAMGEHAHRGACVV